MTADPIQQNRELLTKGIFPEDVGNALNLLPVLINEVVALRSTIEESALRETEYVIDIGNRDEEIQDLETRVAELEKRDQLCAQAAYIEQIEKAFEEGDAEILNFLIQIYEGEHSRISTECVTVLRRLATAAAKMKAKE